MNELAIFTGSSNLKLAEEVCSYLGRPLDKCSVTKFPDGETFVEVQENVRGKDCFIIQSTCSPVNDNLMELLQFCQCLKKSSARSITAIVPYFGYARQDRKTSARTPISAKLVADMIENAGADRVLTMDLHAPQIEGFFGNNIIVDHLTSEPVFYELFKGTIHGNSVILSPDAGNFKTASRYSEAFGAGHAFIDKRRTGGDETTSTTIVGDVDGKNVYIFDDIISTAGTICAAARLVKNSGAKSVTVVATHGVFVGEAYSRIEKSEIDNVYVTNTVPQVNFELGINYISIHKLLGEAIRRIQNNESLSVLLELSNDRIL